MATLFGLWKGMAWQIASLASLVVSFIVAVRMSGSVAPMISAQEPWNRFIAMLLLYLATSVAIWLAFRLVAGIIDRIRLKDFDHQVGALFGLAKGALLCLVITFFAVTLSESLRQSVLKTYSGRTIATLIKQTSPILPDEVRKVLGTYIDQLDRKLDPNAPPEAPAAPIRLSIPLTAERPRADEPQAPQRPIWDWQGVLPSVVPAPAPAPSMVPAPPAKNRGSDPPTPLFPVKLPSRDRT
jgi:membrane protein required for colicin V production